MEVSVIVPVFNAERTLRQCLETLVKFAPGDSEIIIVDDGSTDNSPVIAKEFPVTLIKLAKNSGSGNARNAGTENSRGDILVFIDADVLVNSSTFPTILSLLKNDSDLDAAVGCFAIDHPNRNFFSQYKNLYMHFVFSKMPQHVDFLFTSVCAIKRRAYLGFKKTKLKTDDTELGQRSSDGGKKIMLSLDLEVVHLKRYNLLSLLKNDFIVPRDWAKIFLSYGGFKQLIVKRKFAHASIGQIVSLIAAALILPLVLFFGAHKVVAVSAAILIFIFFAVHANFIIFLNKKKGFLFSLAATPMIYFDMLIMCVGVLFGSLQFLFSLRYKGSNSQ